MAEQGLFGPSPWEIQQAQGRQQYSDAADFARMNATQRGVMGMYQAGGMLGGMGAEALGMKNVAVENARRTEQIMGEGDTDLGTSAGLFAKAKQFMDAGDRTTATKLLFKANEFKRQEAAAALAQQKQDTLDAAQLSTSKLQAAQAEKALRDNPNLKEIEVGVAGKPDYRQKVIVDTHNSAITPVKVGDPYQIAAGVRVDARGGGGGGSGTAPPKNLTREARLGWELENGMIDQATYDAAMSASPGGVLRQKQVESANTARSSFDAVKRNIDQLYDAQSGSLKPAAQSLFGQYAQYRPEMSMSQESVDAKLALEGLTDQVMMANLSDAKARVGQSFGSMQVQEWDKFTQQLTSLKRGLSEKQAAESMKYVLNFIKTKGNVLETALSKPNTVSPPATKPQAASDFNSKWAALKSGQSLVGPDGKTYTKK